MAVAFFFSLLLMLVKILHFPPPVAKDVWEAGLFVQFLEEQDMVPFL